MSFWAKQNPKATVSSARRAAGLGAIGFALLALPLLLTDWPLLAIFFALPGMAIAGAITGWAIEWQIPEDE